MHWSKLRMPVPSGRSVVPEQTTSPKTPCQRESKRRLKRRRARGFEGTNRAKKNHRDLPLEAEETCRENPPDEETPNPNP